MVGNICVAYLVHELCGTVKVFLLLIQWIILKPLVAALSVTPPRHPRPPPRFHPTCLSHDRHGDPSPGATAVKASAGLFDSVAVERPPGTGLGRSLSSS